MADDLIPSTHPKKGNGEASADRKPGADCPKDSQPDSGCERGNGLGKTEISVVFSGVLFLIIEATGLILWQIADGLSGWICISVHWLSFLCLSLGPVPAVLKVVKPGKRLWFWVSCSFVWVVLVGVAFLIWRPHKPEPKPHFILSVRTGDSAASTVFLTNDFLSTVRLVTVDRYANGSRLVSGYVNGCLVIPMHAGQSNMAFNLIAENDSSVKVTDLEIAVAFPKEWGCVADPKWHSIDWSLRVPGWNVDITNLQVWAARSPWVLFPGDSLRFPTITNSCVETYSGPKTKGGFIGVSIRSTDFTDTLAANIIFFPSSSNVSKPFVTRGSFDSNGKLNVPFLAPP